MANVLAFGDSLTWGYIAGGLGRHEFSVRWPNVLAAGLENVRVIEEGLNGRLTVHDDPTVEENRNGAAVLPALLASHSPLDLVIIALGSNDLKFARRCRAMDAAYGVRRLVDIVRGFRYPPGCERPEVLVLAPPALVATENAEFDALFGHAMAESRRFAEFYAPMAQMAGAHFFDLGKVAVADPVDGIHLDANNTRGIGEALIPVVREILQGRS